MFSVKLRQPDNYGSGYYGASRGSRKHVGIDLVTNSLIPSDKIYAFESGVVTKLGYPYGDDLSYRYVEIQSSDSGDKLRYFYVEPSVEKGDYIHAFQLIGRSQDLGRRYNKNGKTITPHIHFEVKVHNKHTNPVPYLKMAGIELIT